MYKDIHTHQSSINFSILNFHQDFESSTEIDFCSLGIHPWYISNLEIQLESLKRFAGNSNVIAIGECGLDKECETPWDLQQLAFIQQIKLAERLNKPLIIHCVKAYDECLTLLTDVNVPVLFHGFNRKNTIAQKILEKGFYLSVGKAIFQTAFQEIFKKLPIEFIFFETDDNTSISIDEIYKKAAEVKNIEIDMLILQIEKNFKRVFKNER
ncbi:MAG TPA: TatD family hydrolase [Edaphocola sp.]|nr:TatD family hydrolase [Edaphocola sp.]